jgi:hypothetical protein
MPTSNARVSVRARTTASDGQYDLLTAALLGVALGAGVALLLRRGPSGRRPLAIAATGAGHGVKWAAGNGAWRRKRSLMDRIPFDTIREEVTDALETARDTVADVVESELRDLRKAIRRQRKRIGI